MQCAIYFIPPHTHALTTVANHWLRRDPYTGARLEVGIAGLAEQHQALLTAAPRRFGFHGKLKAAFELAAGYRLEEVELRLDRFCARACPVLISEMEIALADGGFALRSRHRSAELEELAASIVTEFDHFRSPFTEAQIADRGLDRLTTRQLSHLISWGDPYVLDQFTFHMPLTGPVVDAEREPVRVALQRYFGDILHAPLEIGQIALFIEPEPHAPMMIHSVHGLKAQGGRKIA